MRGAAPAGAARPAPGGGGMAQRTEVLRVYRMLMRAGRTWPTVTERPYILSEARRLFRVNQSLEDPAKIEKKVRIARTHICLHTGRWAALNWRSTCD